MNYDQIKERMKQKYRERKEAEARETLSKKRSAARSVQWDKRKKKNKISSQRDWVLLRDTLYAKLPDDKKMQIEILSKVVASFPDCGVRSTDPVVHDREKKTTVYTKVKDCISFLSDHCSNSIVNMIILHWAQTLCIHDYQDFATRGLFFEEEVDMPLACLAQSKAQKIRGEVFAPKRREDVRRLMHEFGIRVYKVSKYSFSH